MDLLLRAARVVNRFEYFIPLPTWGLNAERSMHWAEHGRRTKEYRATSRIMAKQAQIPRLERVSIFAWPQGPNMRQDVGAAFPAVKAAIDGLLDVRDDGVVTVRGVLPDDTPRHVVRLTMLPPARGEHGLWLLIIDERED